MRHARERLSRFENAALDARVLVSHAVNMSHEQLIGSPDYPMSDAVWAQLNDMVIRRLNHEPVSRIIGYRDFWRSRFTLNSATLDPRADSEAIVEAALECVAVIKQHKIQNGTGDNLNIVDLGTGSGCLLVSLLLEIPDASGVGIDIAPEALDAASANAKSAGVDSRCAFVCGDWGDAINGRFDLIVCNPPYIDTGAITRLQSEVKDFDPTIALDGGEDGLQAYHIVASQAADLLEPGGWLVAEVGADQYSSVVEIFANHGLAAKPPLDQPVLDLAGRQRCVRATGNGILTDGN